ncbi:MAG: NAD-dependent epimerase/dehydratase family protein [Myxococcota bacterium]|jgi:nucleoside-diphosphate-sugar epimerase/predicted dehydrogenase|nr:NAD-dependent epimerase/dehydratase family protein [Myxococcota bacterium]
MSANEANPGPRQGAVASPADGHPSPTNAPVRVALLGAGYIADYHHGALKHLPGVEIAAVCDLSRSRAEGFAKAKGIPGVYTDLGEMLADANLDVVHVLTPPNLHADPGKQILAAGCDVYLEKPMSSTSAECDALVEVAQAHGRAIGISHNFLYFPAYEQLVRDVASGRLGRLDQVDVIWNKELGQLRGGPFGAWMLAHPQNILFEVAPHSFAHVAHLVGEVEDLSVDARDEVELPRGLRFFRRWEVRGWQGATSVRMRFSFVDGYPEHYIHVRGSNGTATVNFETNTYVVQEHTPHLLDFDRFANVFAAARDSLGQATRTLVGFVLSKMGLSRIGSPFPHSIARTVESFYATRKHPSGVDPRIGSGVGRAAIELAERVAKLADLEASPGLPAPSEENKQGDATVLVIGGTGFIGGALVRRLREAGRAVRVMARDPLGCPMELRELGVEIVRGDFTDEASVARALDGIEHVYHLARGFGKTYAEYEASDVVPTRRLAELCLEHGVERFYYASSIAIYYAGKGAPLITETTAPHEGMMRTNAYARSKVENERSLLALHRDRGLPLVIFRPGVVVGRGGSPYHWGVTGWSYNSVARLWGNGNNPLPLVLVDDLADAMVNALAVPGIEGEAYNLCSKPIVTANEYLDAFEERAGLTITRIPTSSARYFAEAVGKWVIKLIGRDPNAAVPSYGDWEGRSFAATFDNSKACQALGWQPADDRETLIREGVHAPVDDFFS